MQIGTGSGLSAQVDAPNSQLLIPTGPPGTTTVRWWATLDDREVTGSAAGPSGELVLPGPIEQLGAVVLLYVDDHGTVLDVVGGSFGVPDGATVPPSTSPGG